MDIMMFTHNHPDHFDAQLVSAYLEANRPCVLFAQDCAFISGMPKLGGHNVHIIPALNGGAAEYMIGGMRVKVYETQHIGGKHDDYKFIKNYCLLLFLGGGRTVLFPGDADFDVEFYERVAAENAIDVLFTNPLYLNRPRGRRCIKAVKARHTIIAHMPFMEDDGYMFWRVVEQGLHKYGDELNDVHVLRNKMQSIVV